MKKNKYQNIYGKVGKDTKVAAFVEIGGIVGNYCKVQAFAFIPPGVEIEDFVFIGPHVCFTNDKYPDLLRGNWEVRKTLVKSGASIGANSTILPGITIGASAVIGAGSVVTKDVPDGETWFGSPAIPVNLQSKYSLMKFNDYVDIELANYISGFVDGEGSFCSYDNISDGKKYLTFTFALESDYRDKSIYLKFKEIIKCGNIYERRRKSKINNKSCHYIQLLVRSKNDLINRVIPFFDTYQLKGLKRIKYQRWRELLLNKKHGT